jgi:hypothetical protein
MNFATPPTADSAASGSSSRPDVATRRSYVYQRIPQPRPRFMPSTSEHMLPSSETSPSGFIFSSKHRLVKRDYPFYQSSNRLQVSNQHMEFRLLNLLKNDWFHVFLRFPLGISILLFLSIWTGVIVIFAGLYMRIDALNADIDCGLGPVGEPISFGPAFAFSLETCTTVGYDIGSACFMDCWIRKLTCSLISLFVPSTSSQLWLAQRNQRLFRR